MTTTNKPLLKLADKQLPSLSNLQETGMGFYIAKDSNHKLYALLADGTALLLQQDNDYFSIQDLIAGKPLSEPTKSVSIEVTWTESFETRSIAAKALSALKISPSYCGTSSSFPLIATYKLAANTLFYRYLRSTTDPRFDSRSGELSAGTYLTTKLDADYANSGFAAVGRFALPIPLPACQIFQYEFTIGTLIEIGTVEPLFGQSGGGVEIRLPLKSPAMVKGTSSVPAF